MSDDGIVMMENPLSTHKDEDATKDVKSQIEPTVTLSQNLWLEKTPIINFLHDAFGDDSTSLESLQEILSTIALMSALLLACVLTFPSSTDNDRYTEIVKLAVDGFEWGDSGDCVSLHRFKEVQTLTSVSAGLLMSSLVGVVFLSISLSSIDKSSNVHTQATVERVWWKHNRVSALLAVVELIVGVLTAMNVFDAYCTVSNSYWIHLSEVVRNLDCAEDRPVPIPRYFRDCFAAFPSMLHLAITSSSVYPCKLAHRSEIANSRVLQTHYAIHAVTLFGSFIFMFVLTG